MTENDLLAELVGLEERFWDSAGDPGFYRRHFADDGVIALGSGIMDRAAVIESMSSAAPWKEYVLHDPQLLDIGDDVAALAYRATARREGDEGDYTATITSVYVKRNGSWKLVIHQQSV